MTETDTSQLRQERAKLKVRLVEIAAKLDDLDKEERAISNHRQFLRDEQARLNRKVYNT